MPRGDGAGSDSGVLRIAGGRPSADRHADGAAAEVLGNRRAQLADRHGHLGDARILPDDGIRDRPGEGLEQLVRRAPHDAGGELRDGTVVDGVRQLVGDARVGVGRGEHEREVELERLRLELLARERPVAADDPQPAQLDPIPQPLSARSAPGQDASPPTRDRTWVTSSRPEGPIW